MILHPQLILLSMVIVPSCACLLYTSWTVYLKSDVKINQFSRFDDDIFTAIENKMVKIYHHQKMCIRDR